MQTLLTQRNELRDINDRLRCEIVRLRRRVSKYEELKKENSRLRLDILSLQKLSNNLKLKLEELNTPPI